ncbi:MAG: SH3 domain-containing protein [Hyphomonas sp.]
MKRAALVLAILLTLSTGAVAQPAVTPAAAPNNGPAGERVTLPGVEPVISRFSKKPVPRFESLRWAEVNGRTGPSLSSPIAWQYNRKGLPVLVVKESGEWYRVRDPAGDEVWVHMRMLTDGTTAMVTRTSILASTNSGAGESVAELGKGVLVEVIGCDTALCEVETAGYRGWMPRSGLWGASPGQGAQPAVPSGTNG